MVLRPVHSGESSPDEGREFVVEGNGKMVCGRSVVQISSDMCMKSCALVECQRSKGNYHLSLCSRPSFMRFIG